MGPHRRSPTATIGVCCKTRQVACRRWQRGPRSEMLMTKAALILIMNGDPMPITGPTATGRTDAYCKVVAKLAGKRDIQFVSTGHFSYYRSCPRKPCACALSKLVKSTYARRERSPPKTVCLGLSSTSHGSSIQQTRMGKACDPRNDMK